MMKRNKKLITLILLSLLCLGLAVTGSLAAFTKTNYVKRVVTTKPGNSDLRFSSNYLLPLNAEGKIGVRQMHLGDTLSMGVTVCNYPQSDMTRFSSDNIGFTLKVQLLKYDGSNVSDGTPLPELKMNGKALTSSSYSVSSTLTGKQASTKLFTFTCSDAVALKDYRLRVEAIPDESSGIGKLAADFLFSNAEPADIHWIGSFYPDDIRKTDSTAMDAFTYKLQGSEEVRLQLIVSSNLEIGKYSLQQLNAETTSAGGKTIITFNVGGKGQPTSYLLQFYRTGPIPNDEVWTTVDGYIELSVATSTD